MGRSFDNFNAFVVWAFEYIMASRTRSELNFNYMDIMGELEPFRKGTQLDWSMITKFDEWLIETYNFKKEMM